MKAVGGVDFTKHAPSAIIQYVQWTRIGQFENCCKCYVNMFYIIKRPHAHLQYVCNIPAKYPKDTLNATGGVAVTKYAVSAINQYVQWTRIG